MTARPSQHSLTPRERRTALSLGGTQLLLWIAAWSGLQAGSPWLGAALGLAAATLTVLTGLASDLLGRRWVVVAGVLALGTGAALGAWGPTRGGLSLIGALLQGLGATLAVGGAWLADFVPIQRRAGALGVLSGAEVLAAAVAVGLVGLAPWGAGAALAGGIGLGILLPRLRTDPPRKLLSRSAVSPEGLGEVLGEAELWAAFGWGALLEGLLVYGLWRGLPEAGLGARALAVVAGLLALGAGARLVDAKWGRAGRWGALALVALGLAAQGWTSLPLPLSWGLLAAGGAMGRGGIGAWVAAAAPQEHTGLAQGLRQSAGWLGWALALGLAALLGA